MYRYLGKPSTLLAVCALLSVPIFSEAIKKYFVLSGGSVDIKCPEKGTQTSGLLKGRSMRPRSFREVTVDGSKITKHGRTFTINNLEWKKDRGYYKCVSLLSGGRKAYDIVGKLERSRFANVDPMPTILLQPLKQSVLEGDTVVFTCTAMSSPHIADVRWYKDKKEVNQSWQRYTTTNNLHKNVLTLANLRPDESGVYECRVRVGIRANSFDGYFPVRARVKVKEFKFLTKSQDYLMAIVGSSLKINCHTSDANASVSLWVKKRGLRTRLRPNRVKVVKKGTRFVVHAVTLSDEGMYMCRARNKQGRSIEMEMGQLIASQGGPSNPKAHIYPLVKTVLVGERTNFSCLALGDLISFEWTKNSVRVSTSQVKLLAPRNSQGHKLNEAVLIFNPTRKADEGIYSCRIQSGAQPGYSHTSNATLKINECPKENGKFKDVDNKKGYIQCTNGIARKRNCRQKQHWNDTIKRCQDDPAIPTTPFGRWLASPNGKKVAPYYGSWTFDCSTSDPTLPVTLWRRDPRGTQLTLVTGKRLVKKGQKFTLHDLQSKTDDMVYVCKTPRLMDLRLVELLVHVDLTPTVSVQLIPSRMDPLDHGDTESIVCHSFALGFVEWYRVDSSNPGTYHLITNGVEYKNNKKEEPHIWYSATLTLSSVTKRDTGIYMCRKNNTIGAVANRTIAITVRDPTFPSAKIKQSSYSTVENKRVRIRCNTKGSPWPKITWYRNSKIVAECSGRQIPVCRNSGRKSNYVARVTKGSHSVLEIIKARYPGDNTVFTCMVRNFKDDAKSRSRLQVWVAPKIRKTKGQDRDAISVLRDKERKLVCKIERSNPPPTISWQFQRWPCQIKDQVCHPIEQNWESVSNKRGRVIEKGAYNNTLLVKGSKEFAFFRCTASNLVAQDSLVFEVQRSSKPTNTILSIKGRHKKTFDEHDNITLECSGHSAFDSPPYWLDNHQRRIVDSPRMFTTTRIDKLVNKTLLHITDASTNMSGEYGCVGIKKNRAGLVSTNVLVNIFDVYGPTVKLAVPQAYLSTDVKLKCHFTGHPRPEIHWYKNGFLQQPRLSLSSISECEDRLNGLYHLKRKDHEDYFTLVICKAQYNNSGSYTCHAQNKQSEDEAQGYLDILGKPDIFFSPEAMGSSWSIGDVLAVECRATGNPKPKIAWMKQADDGTLTLMTRNATLFIGSLSKDDFGTYVCKAGNWLDENVMKQYNVQRSPLVAHSRGTPDPMSKSSLVGLAVTTGIVIVLLLVIIVVLYKRKKKYGGFYILTLPPKDYWERIDENRPLLEQTNKLPLDAEWEFPRDRINLEKIIGSGAFGQVYIAEALGIVAFDPRASIKGKGRRRSRFGSTRSQYQGNKQVTKVACKGLKENATESEYRDLLSELKILMHIGEHKNIVNLLGACTKGRECDLLVIIEYCPHGNLLDFLRKRRAVFEPKWAPATEKPDELFTLSDLVITSFQITRAMQFLASRRCVHRDLAARNVLVGENYIMKIADFGLARDIYKNEHYVKTTAGLLPVKWMAIEALVDQVYTQSSDVWSFGVLLWEIFTLGGSPYPGLPANEVYQYLMEGQRMEQPEDCPDEIYDLMLSCWRHDPNDRPTFTNLLESIDKILEEKTTETGDFYLDLENETAPNENQPEYLEPGEMNSLLPPETPLEDKNFPLPPVPYEEIELKDIPRMSFPDSNGNNKDEFVLKDAPKGKQSLSRLDSEMEKVQRDSLEREKCKHSESSASSQSVDAEFMSEKERRDDEDEKDICERNSGVFNDSPPPYINTRSPLIDPTSKANYTNNVGYSKDRAFRPREQSARYVDA